MQSITITGNNLAINGVPIDENAPPASSQSPDGYNPGSVAPVILPVGGVTTFGAGETGAVVVDHPGGVMELKVEAVRGQGFFTSLTEELIGPAGFAKRTVAPAGTAGVHHPVPAESKPPGTYTYYVMASPGCPLHIMRVQ